MNRVLIALAALSLLACATPYQPRGGMGGFSETQLDQNVFQVRFAGNGYTSGERASDFTLLRSAELALERGYFWFIIVQSAQGTSLSTYTTPTQSYTTSSATVVGDTAYGHSTTTTYGGQTYVIQKPSTMNTIVCFRAKPEDIQAMVYNAQFIHESLRHKYGLPLYANQEAPNR